MSNSELIKSIYRGLYHAVDIMLEDSSIDVNAPTIDDPTTCEYPLTIACKVGNVKIVKRLLEKGANPNIADGDEFDNWTPLHIVAVTGNTPEIFKLLLDYGADLQAVDWDRRSPERFARRYNHQHIIDIIEQYSK